MNEISSIVIAFCEGPHDVAFLYRILRSDCYKLFNEKIELLPFPIKEFIKNGYKNIEKYEQLKMDALKNSNIPNKILYKDNKIILLYAMGGDSETKDISKTKRIKLIEKLKVTRTNDEKSFNFQGDPFLDNQYKYSFLFFYDADNNAKLQLDKVNKYLSYLAKRKYYVSHNEIVSIDSESYGAFIFSKDGNIGNLENIMFEIIENEENSNIIKEAEEYLKFIDEKRYKNKISIDYNNCIEKVKKKKSNTYYRKKSILGIMGQLQNSGASNIVTIEHSDYIKLNKNTVTKNIVELIDFFNKS